MTDLLLTLAAFAFVSAGTPGPNNIMLMTSGMNYGFRCTLPHMLGVAYGFPLMIVGVGLGLSQLFALYPPLETALRIVCAAYLVYLALRIATARPRLAGSGQVEVAGKPLTLVEAAAFQWVNPKAWVMATTALTVYALPLPTAANALAVAGVFAFAGTFTATAWTALGDRLRVFFADPMRLRVFNIVSAVLLLATLIPVFWPDFV